MPYQCRRVVLWYACPLTLGDEPLPRGVEHRALELRVEPSKLGVALLRTPLLSSIEQKSILRWPN